MLINHVVGVTHGGPLPGDPAVVMEYASDTLNFAPPLVGNVAAVVFGYRVVAFGLSIDLQLERTAEHYRAWQISVYEAIMDACGAAEREYRQAVDAYESELEGSGSARGSPSRSETRGGNGVGTTTVQGSPYGSALFRSSCWSRSSAHR